MNEKTDISELEKFILDNPELEKLESLLDQFNIFEVLNIVNAEVRHSSVIAWLLNPNEAHGLGNHFLKLFLKYFINHNKSSLDGTIDLFTVEFLSLKNVEIRKEWNHIDILILIEDEESKFAIAIENKIKTTEHNNQLQRYREIIESKFNNYNKLFIYLSPDGLRPSDENWSVFNYNVIAEIIDNLLKNKADIMNANIKEFISQYNINLRRHIVGNSEIEQICKKIYHTHSRALDLIFQHKPDIQLELSEYIQNKISKETTLILDSAGKTVIRFSTEILDKNILKIGEGWSKSKRILMFEFSNYDQDITLRLIIGPGDSDYRNRLYEFTKNQGTYFNKADRKQGVKWHTVYQQKLLTKKNFEEKISEELKEIIDEKWEKIIQKIAQIDEYFEQNWSI